MEAVRGHTYKKTTKILVENPPRMIYSSSLILNPNLTPEFTDLKKVNH